MGLFGRKKAEEQAAEEAQERLRQERAQKSEQIRAESRARITAWFEALEKEHPHDSTVLTDDLLEKVGPIPLPQRIDNTSWSVTELSQAKSFGLETARSRSISAVSTRAEDAPFWTSVHEYCEGVLG